MALEDISKGHELQCSRCALYGFLKGMPQPHGNLGRMVLGDEKESGRG